MTDAQPQAELTSPDSGSLERIWEAWLEEGAQLRAWCGRAVPQAGAPPARYREMLLYVRGCLDRLEELASHAISVQATCWRAMKDLQDAYDEAWAREAAAGKRHGTAPGPEFQLARERCADYDLLTLKPKREYIKARNLESRATEVLKILQLQRQGADAVRRDLSDVMRALAFESSLDR